VSPAERLTMDDEHRDRHWIGLASGNRSPTRPAGQSAPWSCWTAGSSAAGCPIAGDPTARAEIVALRARRGGAQHRLTGRPSRHQPVRCAVGRRCTRGSRLVWCRRCQAGAVRSVHRLLDDARLNHHVDVTAGVRAEECGARLSAFFRAKRT
jgi:hypothetical protein